MAHLDDRPDDDWDDDWAPEPWDHRDGQPPPTAQDSARRRPAWMDEPDPAWVRRLHVPVDADMDEPPPGCAPKPGPLDMETWAGRSGIAAFTGVLVFLTFSALFGNGGDGPSLGLGLGLIFGIMAPLALVHLRAPRQVWPHLIATDAVLGAAVLLWVG